MNPDRLTDELARRVMGYTVSADRFLTGSRGWIPRWRFDPLNKTEDALRLLEAAQPERFEIRQDRPGVIAAGVLVGSRTGEARSCTIAAAVSRAVARAVLEGIAQP